MISTVINLVLIFREELAFQVMEVEMAMITNLFKDNKEVVLIIGDLEMEMVIQTFP